MLLIFLLCTLFQLQLLQILEPLPQFCMLLREERLGSRVLLVASIVDAALVLAVGFITRVCGRMLVPILFVSGHGKNRGDRQCGREE